MNNYDPYLAVDHVRQVRRRYLGRVTRNLAKTCMHAARATPASTGLLTVLSVAVISGSLWIVPHVL